MARKLYVVQWEKEDSSESVARKEKKRTVWSVRIGERRGGGKQKRLRLFSWRYVEERRRRVEMATAGEENKKGIDFAYDSEKEEKHRRKSVPNRRDVRIYIRMGKKGILNLLNSINNGKFLFCTLSEPFILRIEDISTISHKIRYEINAIKDSNITV